MIRWSLLQQRFDGTWVDTLDTVEADTWGRAAEQLLAYELCRHVLSQDREDRTVYDALTLDFLIGMTPPSQCHFKLNGGRYKIVPTIDTDVTADAAAIVEELRNRGVV